MNTKFTLIDAPPSAKPGDTVKIYVDVQNIGATGGYITVTSDQFSFYPDYLWAEVDEIIAFRGNFTMPANKITITITNWWWNGTTWEAGDTKVITINVQAAVEAEFKDLIGSFSARFY